MICGVCNVRPLGDRINAKTCGEPACVKEHKRRLKRAYDKRKWAAGHRYKSQQPGHVFPGYVRCPGCGKQLHTHNKGTHCRKCKPYVPRWEKADRCDVFFSTCGWCGLLHSHRYRPRDGSKTPCSDLCERKLSYHSKSPEERRAYQAERRRRMGPRARVNYATRHSVLSCVRNRGITKGGRTWALLGYSVDDLRYWLERQFRPGMTWENFGNEWHIDHVVPLSSFRFKSTASRNFRKAWALSNLQPRWATTAIARRHGDTQIGNLEKADRWSGRDQLQLPLLEHVKVL